MPKPKLLLEEGAPVPQFQIRLEDTPTFAAVADEIGRARRLRLLGPAVPKSQMIILDDLIRPPDLLKPLPKICRLYCPPTKMRVRKNQKNLTPTEWARFISAIETISMSGVPSPTYQEFVDVHHRAMHPTDHTGHAWGAHTMGGHDGRNFLAWHREYMAKLEARLMQVNPLVTIPYWDWVNDRALPPELSDPADLAAWGVTRGTFDPTMLPSAAQVALVMSTGVTPPNFTAFQMALELAHNPVHCAVGGTMCSSRSPADPIFWLHHGFIDKLWADWQQTNTGSAFNPPNGTETLQPTPIFTRRVSQVLRTTALGYVYA